jgi:NADH-quinone oxidoreductase subunit N
MNRPFGVDLGTPSGIALALLPEIVVIACALVLMLVAAWRHGDERAERLVGQLSLVGLIAALATVIWFWASNLYPSRTVPEMITLDPFRYALDVVFLLGAIGTVLLSLGYLGRERILVPEYYVLLLFATAGMMLMAGASDLLVLFLGLEVMSVSVYVLAGIQRRSAASAEAALKYFLLGAFASGFLLYGIALLYGATGTTNLYLINLQLRGGAGDHGLMLLFGVALLLVGLGFKVSAAPFHMWAPDVYDGAPTPVTGYMATAVKAAGFAALVRVLVTGFGDAPGIWQHLVFWLAILTMLTGNLVALAQRNVKRMLAYSSIAHAGYLLVAVACGTTLGGSALVFYVLAYTLMTLGAFGVLSVAGREGERDVRIDDLSGLAKRRPWLALAMAIFMLSLLGFPGTIGFIGKWYILTAALGAGQQALAIVLVLTSVVSAGYYLPVVMAMYMKDETEPGTIERAGYRLGAGARAVVFAAALLILAFGVWPSQALSLANQGGRALRPAPPPVIVLPKD